MSHDRNTEYTKWAASRPGVPRRSTERRRFQNPLQRPVLTMLGILAFAIVVGGGAYAMFGAGGPDLSADHEAVVDTLDLDRTICCIEHYEAGGQRYVLTAVLEPRGFLSDTSRDVTFRMISLADGTMEQVASLDAPIDSLLPQSMTVLEDVAYVPLGISDDEPHGIWSIDLSNPEDSAEIGPYTGDDYVTSVQAGDENVLIAHTRGEFQFLDVSDPADPELLGQFRQPIGTVQHMEAHGERLYHRESGSERINIADITESDTPNPLGRYLNVDRLTSTPARPGNVIGSAEERLEVTAPGQRFQDFAVSGQVLYVAASDLGLEVVDVSDPSAPDRLDRIQLEGRAVRVAVAEDRLYVVTADEESRERLAYEIRQFDLSDPMQPELISTIDNIQAAPGRQAMETGGSNVFLGLNDTVLMLDGNR